MNDLQYIIKEAEELASKGIFNKKAKELNTIITQYQSSNCAAYTRLARCLENENAYPDALNKYLIVLQIDPENQIAKNGIRRIEPKIAKNELRNANNYSDIISLAFEYKNNEKYEMAITLFERAIQLHADEVILTVLGGCYRKVSKLIKAKIAYLNAIKIADSYKAHIGLGAVFRDEKEYEKALEEYLYVIKKRPNDTYALNGIIGIYHDVGGLVEAKLEKLNLRQLRDSIKQQLNK